MANGKRKPTPNILGDVLGEEADTEDTVETTEPADEAKDEQGREEVADGSGEEGSSESTDGLDAAAKRKATYYLSEETLSRLEEAWFGLRQLADEGDKRSVSKSAIVEAALEDAIDDLESEGRDSTIARKLLE
jgi:predicted component of type VI protein secretion system